MIQRLLNRLRYRRFDADIAEEIAFHRAMKSGEGPGDVSRAMGNEMRMREVAHDVWVPPTLDALQQDVRHALRTISRRPGFTATIAGVLAVGVTVSVVTFSLLDALVLRPLPVDRPQQLVFLGAPSFSFPILREIRARRDLFPASFAWNLRQADVDWGDGRQPTLLMLASGEMHQTLGVRAAMGRVLTPDDEGRRAGDAQSVAVLSYRSWQERFKVDPAVIGRSIQIDDERVTIVGVTAPEFFGVSPGRAPELTVPVMLAPRLRTRDQQILEQPTSAWLHFMGRLPDHLTVESANAVFQVAWRQALEAAIPIDLPPDRRSRFLSRTTALESGGTGFSSVRNRFRQPLTILAWFAALLLVITCATVGNMLVAQTAGRSRELALRIAIGCGRARLSRQLLFEGIAVAILAGLIALAVAPALSGALVTLVATNETPVTLEWTMDGRVMTLLLAIVGLSALVFTIAPMLLTTRLDAGPALKAGSHRAAPSASWLTTTLVAAQVGCAVVPLVGAGLFLRSLTGVLSIDPGFHTQSLLVAPLPESSDVRAAIDQLNATRGVRTAAASMYPPISDREGSWTGNVGIDGAPPEPQSREVFFNVVTPAFFDTLGMTLVAGRDFEWGDSGSNARVAIINQSAARRYFAEANPLGHRMSVGLNPSRRDLIIVGVVGDAKYQRLQEDQREIAYLPHASDTAAGETFFATVQVARMGDDTLHQLRTTLKAVAPGHNLRLERVNDRIRESLVTERALSLVALMLAGCALLLACAGVFGLMSNLVAQRTREIGIRMALGARAGQVLRRVIVQTVLVTLAGLGVGLSVALGTVRWIQGLLHFVSPTDASTYLAVALLTLALSVVAGWVPARRAASVNPITALRAD